MTHLPPASPLAFGVSYYPEQFGADDVEPSSCLMQEAGFNLVRMGEFAWHQMEPAPGQFDFSWLESAVNTLARRGIRTLLCTPTAAPPKWLSDLHPEICQTLPDGRRREFGKRRHYCANSPAYHRHTREIVTALARHFRGHPHVIGYQLDNEFMAEDPYCYCAHCRRKFQERLRAKFGTVGELNRRWNLAFWSQQYSDFDQVDLPKPGHNPCAYHEFQHFCSDSMLEYARLQAECLKRVSPDKTVTHNVCSSGFLYRLDLHRLAGQLDVVSVDNYPYAWTLENEYGNGADQEYHPAMAALALSITRGLRPTPFWVTEAQTGRTFRPRRGLIEPGRITAWTHQQLAHGARAVLWFPWRRFPGGIEFLMDAVLEADGRPRRRYAEIQTVVRQAQAAGPELAGLVPRSAAALLRDFHTDWALEDGGTHPDFRYLRHLYRYFRACFEIHLNADVIHPANELAGYQLIMAPSLLLMDESRAAHLRKYVSDGGTLVLTVQSGLRNFDNALFQQALPAHLTDLCGLEIEEQHALPGGATIAIAPVAGGDTGKRHECSQLFEIIRPTTAVPLFLYADQWCMGSPAVTVNRFGRGTVYYVAAVPDAPFLREFIQKIAGAAGLRFNLTAASSPFVESVRATAGNRDYLYLINHTGEPQTVEFDGGATDLLGNRTAAGRLELPPFGASLLRPE